MNRIFLRILLGILVALILSIASAVVILWHSMIAAFDEVPPDLINVVGRMGDAFMENMSEEEERAFFESLRRDERVAAELIRLDDPRIPARARERLAGGEPAWRIDWETRDGKEKGEGSVIFVPLENGDVLAMGPQRPPAPNPITWVWIGIAVIAVVAVTGAHMSRPIVRQLRNLEDAAKRIAAGDLSARSKIGPGDAIGPLATTFNGMADRNQELVENQRQITQAVAHELRTPIARIRFGLEMARMERGREEEAERRFSDALLELEELDGLVEELLVFSRYDSGLAKITKTDVDVSETVARQVDRLAPLHPGVEISVEPEGAAPRSAVLLDARSFERVLRNLLGNAVRYARSKVSVRWAIDGGSLIVRVIDDGPGIPSDQRRRVFEPFVRLDESRSRASGGAGLGLAIVMRIMKANGGEALVADSTDGGAELVTVWPVG